jgi:hypothetical protein
LSRSPFGWHYPPGAENDPNAPWNQPDGEYKDCYLCGTEFEVNDDEPWTWDGFCSKKCRDEDENGAADSN